MRAVVCRAYGPPEDVLRCEDVETPIPGEDEVLLEVRAASVNPLDSHLMKGKPYGARLVFGLNRPKDTRPGRDVAGEVVAVGSNVSAFKPGDAVFGACRGAFAEYACADQAKLAVKPEGVTFEQAASAPIAGLTALQALRDSGQLRAGHRVLVVGAAGGVGLFAVQIAKAMGADVTGICSTRNVDLVRALGADRVVDYTTEEPGLIDTRFDLVLDCVCNLTLSARRRMLTPRGRLVIVGAPPGRWLLGMLASLVKPSLVDPFVSQKLMVFLARVRPADLSILGQLIAGGKITPVLDRREGLDAVPQAIRDIASRHTRGKIVIVP